MGPHHPAAENPGPTGDADQPSHRATRLTRAGRPGRRSWPRRHPTTSLLLAFVLLIAGTMTGFVLWVNGQLGGIPTFPLQPGPDRPAASTTGATNFLLAGVDDPDQRLEQALQAPNWQPGVFRTDTIMVVHVDPGARTAQVVSIPRDSYVKVAGHGTTKINAAFSYGGPSLFVRTVEKLTGLRMDHVAVVDFDGLAHITDVLGGVELTLTRPERKPDGGMWTPGPHLMNGAEALSYVRQRKSLPGGDFDRVQRQQNYLRAMLGGVVSKGLVTDPWALTQLVKSLRNALSVDDTLTPGTMRSLGWSMRHLRPGNIRWATAPNKGGAMVGAASVVLLDLPRVKDMFRAMGQDRLNAWLDAHPGTAAELPTPGLVH